MGEGNTESVWLIPTQFDALARLAAITVGDLPGSWTPPDAQPLQDLRDRLLVGRGGLGRPGEAGGFTVHTLGVSIEVPQSPQAPLEFGIGVFAVAPQGKCPTEYIAWNGLDGIVDVCAAAGCSVHQISVLADEIEHAVPHSGPDCQPTEDPGWWDEWWDRITSTAQFGAVEASAVVSIGSTTRPRSTWEIHHEDR